MRIASLASSSKGNAYLIADRKTRILLECGLSYKELQKRAGFDLARLHGCLVSHEHKDHSLSVRRVAESGVPVYMSRGTAEALELPETVFSLLEEIRAGEQFTVGTLDVFDAAGACVASLPLLAGEDVARVTWWQLFCRLLGTAFCTA